MEPCNVGPALLGLPPNWIGRPCGSWGGCYRPRSTYTSLLPAPTGRTVLRLIFLRNRVPLHLLSDQPIHECGA